MYPIIIGAVVGLIFWFLSQKGLGFFFVIIGVFLGLISALIVGATASPHYVTQHSALLDMDPGKGVTYVEGAGNTVDGLTYRIFTWNTKGDLITLLLPRERVLIKENDDTRAVLAIRKDTSELMTNWFLQGVKSSSYTLFIPRGTFKEHATS